MQRIGLEAVLGMTNWNQGVAAYTGSIDSMNRKTGGFASILGGIGKTIAGVGVAAAGLAVGGIALAAKALSTTIGPASNLAESMNKVMVVFGETGDEMVAWSKTAATAMGLSQQQALEAAGTYGNLFSAMGLGPEAAAGMSQELVQLAADLGSFNNIPVDLALEKLRAGLVGEVEPLRTLGVNLSADAVKAKALEMGLLKASVDMTKVRVATSTLSKAQAAAAAAMKKHGENSQEYRDALLKVETAEANVSKLMQGKVGDLTAAQKAQAAYALILEQTSLAQGDFERTSAGLANQQKILKAQFENIKATIGTALLPAITELAGKFTDFLQSPRFQAAITGIADWLSKKLPGIIQGFVDKVSGWAAAIEPFVEPFGHIVDAIKVLLTGGSKDNAISLLAVGIGEFIGQLLKWDPGKTGAAILAIREFIEKVATKAGEIATFVTEMGKMAWEAWLGWLAANAPAIETAKNILALLIPLVTELGKLAWDQIAKFFEDMGKVEWSRLNPPGTLLGDLQNLEAFLSAITDLIRDINAGKVIDWARILNTEALMGPKIEIKGGLLGLIMGKGWKPEVGVSGAGGPETEPAKKAEPVALPVPDWTKYGDKQVSEMNRVAKQVSDAAPPQFEKVGDRIVAGLIAGVSAAWPTLEASMADMAAKLPKVFNAVIQAKSPSKVFMEVGENITKGLQIGMGARPTASMGAMSAAHAVGAVGTTAAPAMTGGRVTNVGGDTIVQNISDPVSFYLAQAMVQDRKRSRWNEAMGVA